MRTFDIFSLYRNDLTLLVSLDIVLECSQTDLRSFGIQHDTQIDPVFFFYFSDCIDPGEMFFMTAMGEIQSYDIHTLLGHLQYRVIVVRSRSQCAYDLGLFSNHKMLLFKDSKSIIAKRKEKATFFVTFSEFLYRFSQVKRLLSAHPHRALQCRWLLPRFPSM